MQTSLTVKGQITIPISIRTAMGLTAGSLVDFAVNREGQVIINKAVGDKAKSIAKARPDRFEAARGKADVKWRTDELMALLRA